VGAAGAPAAAATAADGAAERRPPPDHERHPVGLAQQRAVARPARALRPGRDGVEPVLPLARGRGLGPGPRRAAGRGGREGRGRLGPACTSSTPASSARTGTPPAPAEPAPAGGGDEALGRPQGGSSRPSPPVDPSAKRCRPDGLQGVHLRAEGGGKPITFVLTGGGRHESRMVPALLPRGAVRRPGPGRPRLRPRRVAGDKAFTGRPARAFLRRRGAASAR
jgi:hypothetical protein